MYLFFKALLDRLVILIIICCDEKWGWWWIVFVAIWHGPRRGREVAQCAKTNRLMQRKNHQTKNKMFYRLLPFSSDRHDDLIKFLQRILLVPCGDAMQLVDGNACSKWILIEPSSKYNSINRGSMEFYTIRENNRMQNIRKQPNWKAISFNNSNLVEKKLHLHIKLFSTYKYIAYHVVVFVHNNINL